MSENGVYSRTRFACDLGLIRRTVIAAAITVIGSVVSGSECLGATGRLSWRPNAAVTDTIPADSSATIRLYIRAERWPTIRAAEAVLAVAGSAIGKPAYRISNVEAVAGNGTCNWIWPSTALTLKTLADSAAFFVSTTGTAATCQSGVVWRVELEPTGELQLGSSIELRALRFYSDSEQLIECDSLYSAVVSGGGLQPAPDIRSLWPPKAWPDLSNRILATGSGFSANTRGALAKIAGDSLGVTLEYVDPSHMLLHVTPSPVDTGYWYLTLGDSGSPQQRAPMPIVVNNIGNSGSLVVTKEFADDRGGAGEPKTRVVIRAPSLRLARSGADYQPLAALQQGEAYTLLALLGCESLRCLWPDPEPQPTKVTSPGGHSVTLVDFREFFELQFPATSRASDIRSALVSQPWVTYAAAVRETRLLSSICPYGTVYSCQYFSGAPSDHDYTYAPCGVQGCLRLGQWYLRQTENYVLGADVSQETYGYDGREHEDIDAECAWRWHPAATGIRSTVLAFLDSGIDTLHADLRGGYSTGGNKMLPGADLTGLGVGYFDEDGHGTAVAGIATAITNNGVTSSFIGPYGILIERGVAGVAGGWYSAETPDSLGCSVLPVKVVANDPFDVCRRQAGSLTSLAGGINWAAAHGADVINISQTILAAPSDEVENDEFDLLRFALANAQAQGAACISAMGDTNITRLALPAGFSQWGLTTAVGASDLCGRRVQKEAFSTASMLYPGEGSTLGPWLDVLAPGYQLQVATPNTGAGVDNFCFEAGHDLARFGTSFAAAVVAGVAGGMMSVRQGLHDRDVQFLLRASAQESRGDADRGAGRVSVLEAVKLIAPVGANPPVMFAGTATAHRTVSVSGNNLDVRASDGLIADGVYAAEEYVLEFTVAIPQPCIEPPLFWSHVIGTLGWGPENPHKFNYGAAIVSDQTADSVTFRTTVYRVLGSGVWLPCSPESAQVAYRGVGRGLGTTAVDQRELTAESDAVHVIGSPSRDAKAIVLQYSGRPHAEFSMRLIDASGRRWGVAERRADARGQFRIPLADLVDERKDIGPGVYFLDVSTKHERVLGSRKVVIVQ